VNLYRRGRSGNIVPLILNFGSRLKLVGSFTLLLPYPEEKRPRYRLKSNLDETYGRSRRFVERPKIREPLPGDQTTIPRLSKKCPSRYTDYAVTVPPFFFQC
jgi:hypothetical protein